MASEPVRWNCPYSTCKPHFLRPQVGARYSADAGAHILLLVMIELMEQSDGVIHTNAGRYGLETTQSMKLGSHLGMPGPGIWAPDPVIASPGFGDPNFLLYSRW